MVLIMEKVDFLLFTFVTSTLKDLGEDLASILPKEIMEKYVELLDNKYPELSDDKEFRVYLKELTAELIEKVKDSEVEANE